MSHGAGPLAETLLGPLAGPLLGPRVSTSARKSGLRERELNTSFSAHLARMQFPGCVAQSSVYPDSESLKAVTTATSGRGTFWTSGEHFGPTFIQFG